MEYQDSVSNDRTPLGWVIHATTLPASMRLDSSSPGRASCRVKSGRDSKASDVRPVGPFEGEDAEIL